MDQRIIEKLKALKSIEPRKDFSENSLNIILMSKREPVEKIGFLYVFSFKYAAIAVFSFVLVISGVYGLNYSNEKNKNNLMVKANEVNGDIQIKLDEIKYIIENQPLSINRNSVNDVQKILEGIIKDLESVNGELNNENIDDLKAFLNKIESVQKSLLEINSLIK